MFPEVIFGPRVTLKCMSEHLLIPYLTAFSAQVRLLLHVTSAFEEECYVRDRIEKIKKCETFFYAIYIKKERQVIGALEIRDDQKLRGQLYCWLNENFWKNGYLHEALAVAAPVYFSCTKNNFFTAHVDAGNEQSYRSLKRFGFADAGFVKGPYGLQYELILRQRQHEGLQG
jgi:RimJ/RimL family protein N-acetyltransferase